MLFWFVAALLVIIFIDIHHQIIPDSISLPGIVLGFAGSLGNDQVTWQQSGLGILLGGGVLYATQGQTGQVLLYQHADPSGGTAVWNTARGVPKMVADARSFGITVDPNACSMP